jgi:hypothetical protein
VEVGYLLLWGAREDVEEEADDLKFLRVLRIPFEVGLLELVMGKAVEVIDIPLWSF